MSGSNSNRARKNPARYCLIALLVFSASVGGQPKGGLTEHVVWERDYSMASFGVDAATADSSGNLWIAGVRSGAPRLVCIRSDGEKMLDTPLPREIQAASPSQPVNFKLATSPAGRILLLARYWHPDGRNLYFDGAAFATVDANGQLGPVRRVAGSGPDYKNLIALSDEQFLLAGDQAPLVVIRFDAEGKIGWQREFPANWVLPSTAPLNHGSSCLVSPDFKRDVLHLIWLDALGVVRKQIELAARRAAAAGLEGACTLLYDRAPGHRHGEFHLTSFDASFRPAWTVPVANRTTQGGEYGLAAASNGYLVTLALSDGVLVSRLSADGKLLWTVTDNSRQSASHTIAAGDHFYLIGAAPKENHNFHVLRVR